MKTLSIKNPWAMLIAYGKKPVENRTWARIPNFEPQWVMIHSSKKPEQGSGRFVREVLNGIEEINGAIVGAAYCIGIFNRKLCPKHIWRSDWVNHDANTFLVFDKAVTIEPVFCKGRLGFWEAPEDAVKRMAAAIKG